MLFYSIQQAKELFNQYLLEKYGKITIEGATHHPATVLKLDPALYLDRFQAWSEANLDRSERGFDAMSSYYTQPVDWDQYE